MDKKVPFIIFILSFSYMAFLTYDVPFFWDDHEFHEKYLSSLISDLVLDLFNFDSENITHTSRPIYGIFVKTLFYFFGFNFVAYRIIKALIFAGVFVLLYFLSEQFIKKKMFMIMFIVSTFLSFPYYIHTLVFDEPFIIAELFKIFAFLLLFKDIASEKKSIYRQLSIGMLCLLAIRTYNPAGSTMIILFIFILLHFKLIKRYILLLLFLFVISFPWTILIRDVNIFGPHGFSTTHFAKIFMSNYQIYILPTIYISNLYYLPFSAIFTAFGFGLFILCLALITYKRALSVNTIKFFFIPIWFLAEVPLLLALPESAIRYTSAFIPSIFLVLFCMCERTFNLIRVKKFFKFLVIFFVVGIILLNLMHTVIFRIGWGNTFIGNQKVTDFLECYREKDSEVFYYAGSVANEYIPLKKYTNNYKLADLPYNKISSEDFFNKNNLIKLAENKTIYIIQRETVRKTEKFPSTDLSDYKTFEKIAIIKGKNTSLFNHMYEIIINIFNLPFDYPAYTVYKVKT